MQDGAGAASIGSTAHPSSGIKHPGMNDVMFGRGGDTNYHIGNHRFRVVADEHRQQYRSSTRKEKSEVVSKVVRIWRSKEPPGRFLTKTNPEKGDESLWHDVGDEQARKKAAKILSEKLPPKSQNGTNLQNADASAAAQAVAAASSPSPPPAARQKRPAPYDAGDSRPMKGRQLGAGLGPSGTTGAGSRATSSHNYFPPNLQTPLNLSSLPRPTQGISHVNHLTSPNLSPMNNNLNFQDLLTLYRRPVLSPSLLNPPLRQPPLDNHSRTLAAMAYALSQREREAAAARRIVTNSLLVNNLRAQVPPSTSLLPYVQPTNQNRRNNEEADEERRRNRGRKDEQQSKPSY